MLKVNGETIPARVDWNWAVGGADFVTPPRLYYGFPNCASTPVVELSYAFKAVGASKAGVLFPTGAGGVYMLGLFPLGGIYSEFQGPFPSYRDSTGCVTPVSPIPQDPAQSYLGLFEIVTITARTPFRLQH